MSFKEKLINLQAKPVKLSRKPFVVDKNVIMLFPEIMEEEFDLFGFF